MKSIVQVNKECIVCGTRINLHKHHIYFGNPHRALSEKHGCWCYLCGRHHNQSNDGVHYNHQLDKYLKELAQIKFEELHSREKFMKIFRKNYL